MENSKWMEEIFKDIKASFDGTKYDNYWENISEEQFDLKNKLINALTANGIEIIVVTNRRKRYRLRALLFINGLWKLELPETKEIMEFIFFLKRREIEEYMNSSQNQQTDKHGKKEEPAKIVTENISNKPTIPSRRSTI